MLVPDICSLPQQVEYEHLNAVNNDQDAEEKQGADNSDQPADVDRTLPIPGPSDRQENLVEQISSPGQSHGSYKHPPNEPPVQALEGELKGEPQMPAQMPPPPPPPETMTVPQHVEDPFEGMSGEKSSGSDTTAPLAKADMSPKPAGTRENDVATGAKSFDALLPAQATFDADPFASNSFPDNGANEGSKSDPFATGDDVFTNATTAASEGFDAFPSSTDTDFVDAF